MKEIYVGPPNLKNLKPEEDLFDCRCPNCKSQKIILTPMKIGFMRWYVDNSDLRKLGFHIKDALHIDKALDVCKEYTIECKDCHIHTRSTKPFDKNEKRRYIKRNNMEKPMVL